MMPMPPKMQQQVKAQAEHRLLTSRNQLLSARIIDKLITDPKYSDQLGLAAEGEQDG